MVDVRTKITINKPLSVVAAYAQDPEAATAWYKNIKTSKLLTPKPVRVGSRIDFKAHFLGKKITYTYEVVALEPNKKLVMRTSSGPFTMETTYEWEAVDQNTTIMKLRNRGEPKGFSAIVTPFMSMVMHTANNKDLRNIKAILES